jgi:hypothetical protein
MAFIKAAYAAVRVLAAVSISLSKSASELPELLPTTPRYSLKNFEGNQQTPLGVSVIQSRHRSSLPVF